MSTNKIKNNNLPEDAWIQTVSGIKFYPFNPEVEDINWYDLAVGLSNTCKYGGQLKNFYSIAQSAIVVTDITLKLFLQKYPRESKDLKTNPRLKKVALYGLINRGYEAYINSIPDELRATYVYSDFNKYQNTLQRAIYEKAGLPPSIPDSVLDCVKTADLCVRTLEFRSFRKPIHSDTVLEVPFTSNFISSLPDLIPMPSGDACNVWLSLARDLGNARDVAFDMDRAHKKGALSIISG